MKLRSDKHTLLRYDIHLLGPKLGTDFGRRRATPALTLSYPLLRNPAAIPLIAR